MQQMNDASRARHSGRRRDVVNREGVLYEGSSGLPTNANLQHRVDDKPVSSVAIMMLVEQGQLRAG